MEKLKAAKKITLATLKSFAKRNASDLFSNEKSDFDGMVDCVMPSENQGFKKTEYLPEKTGYYRTGIHGIYTVGSSRDYLTFYEDANFIGIRVSNCCGCSILAIKKEVEFVDFEKELLN